MALTAQQAASRVNALYTELASRRPQIKRYEDYHEGKQPLCYSSDEFKRFHGERFKGWSDNWCGVVGSAAPELTEFAGIHLGEDEEDLSSAERVLLRDWNINDGQAQSAQGFLSGAVASRSFALVWGDDDDEPVLTWEHASQAVVGYHDNGRRRDGLKVWVEDKLEFANLYTPDGLWKFERDQHFAGGQSPSGLHLPASMALEGGWRPREVAGEPWPVRNPMGIVPLVELPNRPLLGKGPISDIQGTIAAQDAVNLMWAYLFGAADFASHPARVIMGQEPPMVPTLDENGQKIGEKPLDLEQLKKGRMLYLTGQKTTIGQWDAAKLDVFSGVVDVLVKHIGAQSRTPLNYFGAMSNINGETLDSLRIPLHNKVRDGQKHLNGPMREIFRLMALARGDNAVAEQCRTATIQWKNPETATDAQTSDAALKDKQIGWSAAGILERRYGMSQQEVEREIERRRTEADDPVLAALNKPAQFTTDADTDGTADAG